MHSTRVVSVVSSRCLIGRHTRPFDGQNAATFSQETGATDLEKEMAFQTITYPPLLSTISQKCPGDTSLDRPYSYLETQHEHRAFISTLKLSTVLSSPIIGTFASSLVLSPPPIVVSRN